MYTLTLHKEPWQVQRLGIVMAPDLADPREAGGVLNPAAARGPDGELYLLPRLMAAGNYSRIGLARVYPSAYPYHKITGDPAVQRRIHWDWRHIQYIVASNQITRPCRSSPRPTISR